MQNILNHIIENYILITAFLSLPVFFAIQYLTRGVDYFLYNQRIRYKYLACMSGLQLLISLLVMWIVYLSFNSEFLQDYISMRELAVIIVGGSPFNVSILIWVLVKIEAYKFMEERYGDKFLQDPTIKNIEKQHKQEDKT